MSSRHSIQAMIGLLDRVLAEVDRQLEPFRSRTTECNARDAAYLALVEERREAEGLRCRLMAEMGALSDREEA
ncbi:MAG: hypothetical protein AAGN35_01715 [Bacteroidota bacterium]